MWVEPLRSGAPLAPRPFPRLHAPGTYLLVDHSLARLQKSALGMIEVEGPEKPRVFQSGKMESASGGHGGSDKPNAKVYWGQQRHFVDGLGRAIHLQADPATVPTGVCTWDSSIRQVRPPVEPALPPRRGSPSSVFNANVLMLPLVASRLRERFAVRIVADRGIMSLATMNREPSADILIESRW